MSRTQWKFESWKVRIHIQNASQSHFYCFLKDIWTLKSSCSLRSPTYANSILQLVTRMGCMTAVCPRIFLCQSVPGCCLVTMNPTNTTACFDRTILWVTAGRPHSGSVSGKRIKANNRRLSQDEESVFVGGNKEQAGNTRLETMTLIVVGRKQATPICVAEARADDCGKVEDSSPLALDYGIHFLYGCQKQSRWDPSKGR